MQDKERISEAIELLASENRLTQQEVYNVIEETFLELWKENYGEGYNIVFKKDKGIKMYRVLEIVDNITDPKTQVSGAEIGTQIKEEIDMDFSRSSLSNAIKIIQKKIHQIKREKEYELYKDQKGQLLSVHSKDIVGKIL